MQPYTIALETVAALAHHLGKRRIKRICKHDMPNHAALEKRERSDALGTVDDLVWHDKVTRLNVLAQTTNGGESDDCAHAERAECGNVCT